MRSDLIRALAGLVFLGLGCGAAVSPPEVGRDAGEDLGREPVRLLDPVALRAVEAEQDPLSSHRPQVVDCPPGAWGAEGGGFEVQTGVCNYAAFSAPLPRPVEAGDTLSLTIWHDLLDAIEPGTGHVAVLLGATVVWEAVVEIPSSSSSFEVAVLVEATPPASSELGLHLHNHGFNSWRFLRVDLVPR